MNEERFIKSLGVKKGKLLFFGGVYSNLQSLEALQKWAVINDYLPENIFCTGDVLGYCAQPVECISLLRKWGVHTIAGNVELQLRKGEKDCGCDFRSGGRCDLFSLNWYAYTQRKLNEPSIAWLHTLPHHIRFIFAGRAFLIVHGSWFNTAEFIFNSTPWAIKQKNFDATNADVIIAGHSGLPFVDAEDGKHWLNAGVIGMPANDGTDRVWFVTIQEGEKEQLAYQFQYYRYDNNTASIQMRNNGLPQSYADTLISGIWDNVEILPKEEILQGGKALHFEKESLIK